MKSAIAITASPSPGQRNAPHEALLRAYAADNGLAVSLWLQAVDATDGVVRAIGEARKRDVSIVLQVSGGAVEKIMVGPVERETVQEPRGHGGKTCDERIVEMAAEGLKAGKIAKALNDEGFSAPNGKPWVATVVGKAIKKLA